MVKNQKHCGRIVVSGSWEFCPFCGKSLADELNKDRIRKKIKGQTKQQRIVLANAEKRTSIRCIYVSIMGKNRDQRCVLPAPHPKKAHRYPTKAEREALVLDF